MSQSELIDSFAHICVCLLCMMGRPEEIRRVVDITGAGAKRTVFKQCLDCLEHSYAYKRTTPAAT